MSPPGTPPPSPRIPLTPRVKVWFEAADGYSFGYGLISILQAIDRTGSIKQAALDLGQSYRHVWGRIKEAEQALGIPLVKAQVGGQGSQRSELSHHSRRLIDEMLAIRARMFEVMETEFPARPTTDSRD